VEKVRREAIQLRSYKRAAWAWRYNKGRGIGVKKRRLDKGWRENDYWQPGPAEAGRRRMGGDIVISWHAGGAFFSWIPVSSLIILAGGRLHGHK
jgi:hypothetical protein